MENTNAPAVSVVIPMYNAERYIGECLDSLLNQTFQDFEVIVVDDCSSDNSRAVAKSYVEKFGSRLKIYVNGKNSGAAAARNNGLMLSHGEYVYYMDSDDLLLLTGLEEMYTAVRKFDADFVNLPGYYRMSANAKEITTTRSEKILKKNEVQPLIDEDLTWRLEKPLTYRYYGSAVLKLFRRDFLIKNRLFFPENVSRCEDVVWKYGILLFAKRIVHLPVLVYFYRMTAGSLSRKRRAPTEYINSRMTTIIDGIKWIDNIISRVDFFKQKPEYRYAIFEEFMNDMFKRLLVHSQEKKWSAKAIYDAVKQGFSEKLGKHDVLVSELCSLIDAQLREIVKLEKQLKAN